MAAKAPRTASVTTVRMMHPATFFTTKNPTTTSRRIKT